MRALALVLLVPASAFAEGKTSSLSVVREPSAESCMGVQEIARAVEARLARRVFVSASEADLSVEVRLWKQDRAWHAHIDMHDAHASLGTRDLEKTADTCDALGKMVEITLAVMIDPVAKTQETQKEIQSVGGIVIVTAPPPKPPPPEPSPWRLDTQGALFFSIGITPKVAFGLGGTTLLRTPLLPIAARASFQAFLDTGADLARANFFRGSLGVCPLEIERGRFFGTACVGGSLGVIFTRTDMQNEAKPHADLALDARLGLHTIGPFTMGVGTAFLVPLAHHDLVSRGMVVFRTAPIAGMADLWMGLRIP